MSRRPTSTLRAKLGSFSISILACLAAGLGLTASANAAQTYPFDSTFTASDAPSGVGPMGNPLGMAVDNSGTASQGRVYVGDSGTHLVYVFDENGNYLSDITGFGIPYGIAVDQTNGDVYVADLNGDVRKFTSAGGPVHEFGSGGELAGVGAATGIAVDPSTDDLYVASEGSTVVNVFDPDGKHLGEVHTIPAYMLAIDSQGNLFAANGNEIAVYKLSTGELNESYGEGTGILDSHGSIGVGVNQKTNDVFAADEGRIIEYDGAGEFVSSFGEGHLVGERDVAVNEASGKLYATNQGGGSVSLFGPPVSIPSAVTGPVSVPGPNSATVTAKVDPSGAGPITECAFEYGTDTSYGKTVPCEPATPYSAAKEVTAHLAALTSDTTYHYRVTVSNGTTSNTGLDRTYTPHAVRGITTKPATGVAANCAVLHGSFIGNGEDTHYYFDWGTDPSYGHQLPAAPGSDAGSPVGPAPTQLEKTLCGLNPQAEYHFRLVASNNNGTSYGEDSSFVTLPAVSGLKTEAATGVTDSHATLDASFEGNGEDTHYYFEWGTEGAFGHVTAAPPGEDAGSPASPQVKHLAVQIAELMPATYYEFRVVADNGQGTTVAQVETFTTSPAAPAIRGEGASGVNTETATVHAEIDPAGGLTTYQFEYGTEDCATNPDPCTAIPVPARAIGSGIKYVPVSVAISGLTSGVKYYWRVKASNLIGPTVGGSHVFTTLKAGGETNESCPNGLAREQTGAALLPDCRAYELVSAANAGGYDVESSLVPGETPYSSYPDATAPPRVLYAIHDGGIPGTNHPTEAAPDPYVATRTATGWTTEYVGISASYPFASGPFSSVPTGASSDLGAFAFGGEGSCSPCFEGGYTGIPVRMPDGELVQGMVPASNVTPPAPSAKADGHVVKDVSANGEHLIFGSTAQFAEGGNDNTGDVSIYDRDLSTKETHVVSNAPGGGPLACLQGAGQCDSAHGDANGISELAISADGSRVILGQKVSSDKDHNVYYRLFMDIGDSGQSVELTPGAAHGALFDGMTADGSTVFFSTADALSTSSDQDTDGSADIYAAEVGSSGQITVTRISTGPGPPGNVDSCDPVSSSSRPHWNDVEPGENCGVVAIGGGGGAAAQGGAIYFLSPEKLSDEASCGLPCAGGGPIQDQPNLYVAEPGSQPEFVATLSPNDPLVVESVSNAQADELNNFQTSDDGQFAVLSTTRQVGEYDNSGYAEIYRYDAEAPDLDCVSCDPSNALPVGSASFSPYGKSLSDDGRVFFDTPDSLSAQALDERENVYEWEGGVINLISTGKGLFASKLLGISPDAKDVYFFTRDSMAIGDENGPSVKIYDARVEGGFFVIPSPPPCRSSDECHGPGSPQPEAPNLKSTSPSGVGNETVESPTRCKKGTIKKHGKCVTTHQRRKKKQGRRKSVRRTQRGHEK